MDSSIKVFYCIYQNKKAVDHDEPISVMGIEIPELIEEVTSMKENFIGFVDKDETSLQFFIDDLDEIWMEIPIPAEKCSYGTYIDRKSMQEIVQNLKAPFIDYKEKFNLDPQPW